MTLQLSGVKFPLDSVYASVHQKLLKFVNFSPSYSKYKRVPFFETGCTSLSAHHMLLFDNRLAFCYFSVL